jgi:hypothetical protein
MKRINMHVKELITSPMIPNTFDRSRTTAMILTSKASGEPKRK